jgi:site-specific recombinase XerD
MTHQEFTFLAEGSMENIDKNRLLDTWLSTYSQSTKKAYSKHLALFLDYCTTLSLNPDQITHVHLEVYKEDLLKKHSIATVAQIISSISSYYDFLEGNGLVKNNPVKLVNKENLKTEPYTSTVPINPMGVKTILDSIDPDTPNGSRDYAILALIFFHGVKASYALQIRMKDFIEKSDGEYLVVLRKDGSHDEVLIEPCIVDMIEYCLSFDLRDEIGDDELVFLPTKETGKHLLAAYEKCKKAEGLTLRALQDNLGRYAKVAGCEGITLNSIYQAGAYYRHCMGMEDEQVKYYMDHSTKSSIRRFLRQRAKIEALSQQSNNGDL